MKNATPPRFLVRLVLAGAALATVTAAFCQTGEMNYAPVPQARPQAAISGNLDNQTTGAIRVRPQLPDDRPPVKSADIAALKSGLDALTAKDLGRARAVRDALPAASLDHHILAWAIALRGGSDISSGEIAAAAQALPGWPGMAALRRNSERALLRENPAARTVVQAFGATKPQTAEGMTILARSLVALDQPERARALLSPFWRTEKLEAKDEAAIVKEFGSADPGCGPPFSHGAHVVCGPGELCAAHRGTGRRKTARRCVERRAQERQERRQAARRGSVGATLGRLPVR